MTEAPRHALLVTSGGIVMNEGEPPSLVLRPRFHENPIAPQAVRILSVDAGGHLTLVRDTETAGEPESA